MTIGQVWTNLPFERKDSTVTLLKNDQVLMNLLTDIVSEKRRATNIKPKIPSTFSATNETREKVGEPSLLYVSIYNDSSSRVSLQPLFLF